MIKYLFTRLLLPCLITAPVLAQKKPIEMTNYDDWHFFPVSGKISKDGKHLTYFDSKRSVITLASASGNWKKEFVSHPMSFSFTSDSKMAVLKLNSDSLAMIDLVKYSVNYIPDVQSFKISDAKNNRWLLMNKKAVNAAIELLDISTGKKQVFAGGINAWISGNNKVLCIQKKDHLVVHDLAKKTEKKIWNGDSVAELIIDDEGNRISFISGLEENASLLFYKRGMNNAEVIVASDVANAPLSFGIDEQQVIFHIKPESSFVDQTAKKPTDTITVDGSDTALLLRIGQALITDGPWDGAQVEVWNYKDKLLYPNQGLTEKSPILATVNTKDKKIIRLIDENEKIIPIPEQFKTGNIFVINENGDPLERYWNEAFSNKVISATTGKVIKEFPHKVFVDNYSMSDGGRYISYFDYQEKHYFTYDIKTGRTINVSQKITSPLTIPEDDMPAHRQPRKFIEGPWLANDEGLFIEAADDIWLVDPTAKKDPVNITMGVAKRDGVKLWMSHPRQKKSVKPDAELILFAINPTNRQEGFYSVKLGSNKPPRLLSMGDYTYEYLDNSFFSENDNGYIVQRSRADDAKNLFYSKDLVNFKRLTDFNPQRNHNWMTSEIVNWTSFDGRPGQGILYKPENFDPNKKYPVIFYYYRFESHRLHQFEVPDHASAGFNIPYYVSNGYLVFRPNVSFIAGQPAKDVHNFVVSGAKHIAKNPWVDASKMGITGFSFGGYETNLLVTSTNIFAAAAPGAGVADLVSHFGEGSLQMMYCERGANNIGVPLWENPNLYIENSPVFHADKVTTPTLILHNKGDENVPFAQSREFFLALRRLKKKAWLLQYDGEAHGFNDPRNGIDYNKRQLQFFDHYLKGKPAPKWMTEGVPKKLKGKENGLQLELAGRLP